MSKVAAVAFEAVERERETERGRGEERPVSVEGRRRVAVDPWAPAREKRVKGRGSL